MSFSQIGDHVELQRGNTYKSALLDAEGPFLLGLGSIQRDGGFKDSNLRTYGGPSAEKMLVYPGDLYVSLKDVTQSGDLLGSVARVPKHIPVGRMTQDTVKLLFKSDIDRNYFYWLLRTPEYRSYCRSRATGTTNLGLSRDDFFAFEVPGFSDTRQRLVNVLEHIESKIVTSVRINHTLEAIAQAIFKSWFVDFEPTKAKIAAREALQAENPDATPKQIATAEQQAAIQALAGAGDVIPTEQFQIIADFFPNQLVESELGEIPDGWEVSEIGNEVKVCGGGTPSTKNAEFWDKGNIAWTTPKDLSGKTSKILIDTDRKITELGLKKISSGLLPVNTVLLSSRAPVGYLALAKIPLAVNQGYIAMVCDKNITPEFVINWCDSVMDEIKQRASGTTFLEISKKNFKLIKITLPPKTLCEVYSLITEPLYNLISSNETESEMLKNIRDSILPKLLSGEIGSSLMEMSGE